MKEIWKKQLKQGVKAHHHIIYNILRGKDPFNGFKVSVKRLKNDYWSYVGDSGLFRADRILQWLRRHIEKLPEEKLSQGSYLSNSLLIIYKEYLGEFSKVITPKEFVFLTRNLRYDFQKLWKSTFVYGEKYERNLEKTIETRCKSTSPHYLQSLERKRSFQWF